MNNGDKIIIKKGCGFDDYTDGIQRFTRTQVELKGTIENFINYSNIWIRLDDRRYIKTTDSALKH